MNSFEERLTRLRSVLGLKEDQEVAAALGMTKAAFSNRKKTQSFPIEKLGRLLERWPDFDLHYVLTGERLRPQDRAFSDGLLKAAAERGDEEFASAAADNSINYACMVQDVLRNPGARHVVELLIWCDDDAIEMLRKMALKLRMQTPLPFDRRPSTLPRTQEAASEFSGAPSKPAAKRRGIAHKTSPASD